MNLARSCIWKLANYVWCASGTFSSAKIYEPIWNLLKETSGKIVDFRPPSWIQIVVVWSSIILILVSRSSQRTIRQFFGQGCAPFCILKQNGVTKIFKIDIFRVISKKKCILFSRRSISNCQYGRNWQRVQKHMTKMTKTVKMRKLSKMAKAPNSESTQVVRAVIETC